MKPVDQTVIDRGFGNCLQASIASLFELELSMVPNFIRYSDASWTCILNSFIWSIGYEWVGTGYPVDDENKRVQSLTDGYDVNGHIEAAVPSKSFDGARHSVIINLKGLVVHDPNPNKMWEGINVLESGDLKHWTLFKKREDFEYFNLIRTYTAEAER